MTPDFATGHLFGGYRLGPVLGRGGMGVVYRAEHIHLERTVALKLLSSSLSRNAEFRDRFLRESRLAASIDHPSIVTVYDAGEHAGTLYLAMRFVPGGDLAALLSRTGPLEPARALALLGQIGSALDAAHARGLVHRDVKPGNVMVEGDRCYLTDFGLTKQTAATTSNLTATGVFLGTPDYAAPEQIEARPLDARSDVYALAGVLYRCVTGVRPYDRSTPVAVLYAHLRDPPPRPSQMRPGLPRALDDVIARGMAKRPEDRPDTCSALLESAAAALAGGRDERPTGRSRRPAPPPEPAGTDQPTEALAPAQSQRTAALPAQGPGSVAGPQPLSPPPPPPPVQRARRGPGAGLVLALLLAGAVAAGALLLLTGGSDDGGSSAGSGGGSRAAPSQARVIGKPIPVGRRPIEVVVADGALWVANNSGGTVTRAPLSGGERQSIAVGGEPFGLTRAGDGIWVARAGADSVVRIDTSTGQAGAPVAVGPSPYFLDAYDSKLYVANGGGRTVSVLDARTGAQVRGPIDVADQPRGIVANPEGIWVASRVEDTVTRVRDSDVDVVPIGRNPVAMTSGGGAIWVANKVSGTVTRIEPRGGGTRRKNIKVGKEPFGVAFGAGSVWVTNGGDDTVMRLDPATGAQVGDPIEVAGQPTGVTVGSGSVWVTVNDADAVVRIDPDP